jgi:hypothetical protein
MSTSGLWIGYRWEGMLYNFSGVMDMILEYTHLNYCVNYASVKIAILGNNVQSVAGIYIGEVLIDSQG